MDTQQNIPLDAVVKLMLDKGWTLDTTDSRSFVFKGPRHLVIRLERDPDHPGSMDYETLKRALADLPRVPVPEKTAPVQPAGPSAVNFSAWSIDPEKIYQQIQSHPRLPSPNATALEVLGLCTAQDVDQRRLEKVISGDIALAARVVQHINAAYYGLSRKIDSLQRAIQLLGPRRIRNIVLSVTTIAQLRQGPCEAFDYEACWSCAAAQGHAAEHITTACAMAAVSPNTAFTAGLFSRLGQLALATVFPDGYGDVLRAADPAVPESLLRLEQQCFGVDHFHLAARLLADWRLPDYLCRAIACQSSQNGPNDISEESPEWHLARVLTWADAVAQVMVHHVKKQRRQTLDQLLAATHTFGVDLDTFNRHFHQIGLGWVETGKLLNLDLSDVTPWDQIYAQAG